jgi:hypothetical protein
VVCFIVILYFSKMAFPSSPEKKHAASKSPSPTFRAKKRKAGAESKEPDPQADSQAAGFWNQKLDFIIRDSVRFTLRDFQSY